MKNTEQILEDFLLQAILEKDPNVYKIAADFIVDHPFSENSLFTLANTWNPQVVAQFSLRFMAHNKLFPEIRTNSVIKPNTDFDQKKAEDEFMENYKKIDSNEPILAQLKKYVRNAKAKFRKDNKVTTIVTEYGGNISSWKPSKIFLNAYAYGYRSSLLELFYYICVSLEPFQPYFPLP